jgi:hypothetical protein
MIASSKHGVEFGIDAEEAKILRSPGHEVAMMEIQLCTMASKRIRSTIDMHNVSIALHPNDKIQFGLSFVVTQSHKHITLECLVLYKFK